MEQIYTIPVNEAFDSGIEDPSLLCPFCALYRKLQESELDRILGAAMMEPDVRTETNRRGFCLTHFRRMLRMKNRLGIALMLESHLEEVGRRLSPPALSLPGADMRSLSELESSCYLCDRIEEHLSRMIETAVYMYDTDPDFKEKYKAQTCFCLPHYRRITEAAKARLGKRQYREFYSVTRGIQERYLEKLRGDVSHFCRKFDYRSQDEPWYDSKDSIERAVGFLRGRDE